MAPGVQIIYANALGWRVLSNTVGRVAAALNPARTFIQTGYNSPRYLRPLLKDTYGMGWPNRLNLMASIGISAGRTGRRLLRDAKAEALILLGNSTLGVLEHVPPGMPVVLVTDVTYAQAVATFGARYSKGDIAAEGKYLSRCRKVFAMSGHCAASLQSDYGLSAARIGLFLPPTEIPQAAARPAGPLPVIGFVGADFERKGGHDLLRVFTDSLQDLARLVIVSKTAPDVNIPGVTVYRQLDHAAILSDILPAIDIFCLPTHKDCSGLAIGEALAAGVCVVTTNLPALRDLVVENETGLLVRPRDEDALRRALGILVGDATLRQQFAANARAFAERALDARRQVGSLLEALQPD